ncbi:acyl carrier protein [Frankia sp. CNm7]|uniref:Acyl carrier protein n=1 Tax=Frankia nepalensis TaxID=1836974 RepID=A0A937UT30_9ACTN|nr:acyl carrier protein [Frankia nepalensis]MBL7498108.1 acyl carrier protein [Frankia nepalensis]MBL7509277.1 acyl carrier protein [Frankia nepalensis]MBL7519661.1 acyl carrier protein [Frankia nepalensis]MBL7633137.1 acyl carrier protein [Frankia nepalensis]
MSPSEILTHLTAILVRVAEVDSAAVTADKSFVEDLDVDSLVLVEAVVVAEDEFGVRISDDDMEHISTVGELVGHIERASSSAAGETGPAEAAGVGAGSAGQA